MLNKSRFYDSRETLAAAALIGFHPSKHGDVSLHRKLHYESNESP
jgi:hypothetical protein